ncbi:alpha-protein kinase 3 [Parambassis ranga]|uniref:non-specific serine/threonine protein kinase n=1 Tax=Parambassis ranga TaxID=210632 RepID=A0A6P7HXI6_9TELE|nr:alpha-protein kinase 3-like [Parambassis ranga]XP_028258339.1 alpha-protein kinase 3-like [Parambassis ranga]
MGSRRTTTRSSLGNGRSNNGGDVSGSSRPGGCSYLSNVRPETRSTLCSVMAQLTEETQPSFETTLKSKAVSEKCNVKFTCVVTGYPAPQVMWYKDDIQLDRYCGLPKYEIFRNGQNHTLHIYNCTVEDAAIYQASAMNSKGIVSCSGVLEVGEMNEFKIHQRYFNKLKQKAENRRRETEGKENQEPLRTISPDRTQRKRRSTMEAFLSTPSSMEEEGNEKNHDTCLEAEARLQEATVEEVKEKPLPVANGAVAAVTNEQAISDNGSKGGTYDSAQKIFTALQTKTPFVKKKIKISNSTESTKADFQGERVSGERKATEEPSLSLAPACTEAVQMRGNSEEFMEVENIVNSSTLVNMIDEQQKSATEEAKLTERLSKNENKGTEEIVSTWKEELTASVPHGAHPSTGHTVSGTAGKRAAKQEQKAGLKGTQEIIIQQSQILCSPSTHVKSSVAPTPQSMLKEDIQTTEHGTAMDVDVESKASSDGSLAHQHDESVDTLCDTKTAVRQRERAGDQLSEKETRPCQKKVSASQPALPSEVTQAHTKMQRNGAPVSLEQPPRQSMIDSQLQQKTLVESDSTTNDNHNSSLQNSLEAATDEMAQDKWHYSKESNESHTVIFAHLQESPLNIPSSGVNAPGCKVSPGVLQSQVDTAIKTVEETEIQHDEKVRGNEVGKLPGQADRVFPMEKTVDMGTKIAPLHMTEQTKPEKTKDAETGDTGRITVDAFYKETEKNKPTSKVVRETISESQDLKSDTPETAPSLLPKLPQDTNLLVQSIHFQEVTKPETKVISVAELLRSQMKALNATLENSGSTIMAQDNIVQVFPTIATGRCQEVKSWPDKGTNPDHTSPTSIKATLMQVYHQLNKTDEELIQTQNGNSTHSQVFQGTPVIPPVSVTDITDITVQPGRSVRKYNESVMHIGQETGPSLLVPPNDCSMAVSLSESKNINSSFTSLTFKNQQSERPETILNTPRPVSQKSVSPLTVASTQQPNVRVLGCTNDEPVQSKNLGFTQMLTSEMKLNSETERRITLMNLTTPSDNGNIRQPITNTISMQSVQKFPSQSTGTQEINLQLSQQGSSLAEDGSLSDSTTNPTPEPSPLLTKRNCVSPIPSATPQELASGARRKILTPKAIPEEVVSLVTQKKEVPTQSSKLSTSSPSTSRRSPLLQPAGEGISRIESLSPLMSRRRTTSETQTSQLSTEDNHPEEKPAQKDKYNPFKAPQVIRKIRSESFADASGHLKLWCQFFNVLSDSVIMWYKNEEEIAQVKRKAGDESQVNLAIVQAFSKDAGVYGCSITNEYGTDSTDILLSSDIIGGMSLREDLGVGEEIEMTPMIFSKGVADSGAWGNRFFGRIMMKESHIGDGCSHKVWRAKVIYGLEPLFESGNTCIIKVRNPVAYGGKEESCLTDRNLDIMKQECKIQNLAREYCKIFSAEARVVENFGPSLEVIPVYLMYRPANTVPYAMVEADLTGLYQKYSVLDHTGRIDMRASTEVEQKCCALQHWIFQWTNGNLLLTRLEGVDTKITNVRISVKTTGHQGLSVEGNPKVFEQFVSQHKCNYFCGLLGLRSMKVMESLMLPTKPKGSKSPLLQRKMAAGSSSPQTSRKGTGSPRLQRKAEQNGNKTPTKQKSAEAPKVVKTALNE